jgi:hypothetical protein
MLHKDEGKPMTKPASYRRLSFLDGVNKLFERLLHCKLNNQLDRTGGLSEVQFGFRLDR